MKRLLINGCMIAALAGMMPLTWAQDNTAAPAAPAAASAPRATPRPDELEPGVDTSASEHAAAATHADRSAATGARPAAAATPARSRAAGTQSTADRNAGQGDGKKAGGPKKAGEGKAQDRLQLDASQITGNRELPKVMYIVPWKHSDLGDLNKPMNSLVDEVLQPIDRDVFRRTTRYYDALKPDAVPPQAASAPAESASH